MNGFASILSWVESNVKMHWKRRQTLAHLVVAAMAVRGMGVLSLGRAMQTSTTAKHAIKRVWRFFKNDRVECEAVHRALFEQFAPREGRIVILVDWTDFYPYTQLAFAFPRDGRALPFLSKTVYKEGGEGSRIRAETWALAHLARLVPEGREVVLVADRGFGNQRWMKALAVRQWWFVQRIARTYSVDTEGYIGHVQDMRFRRRTRPRDYGWGHVGEEASLAARLVIQYGPDYDEPWFLVTNLQDVPAEVVRYYQRRMWIEAMFRDWKNKRWGLGLKDVRLSEAKRHDRLFLVLALAYIFLSACGAHAEKEGLGKALKANTVSTRVMTFLRMGIQLLMRQTCPTEKALKALAELPS